MAENYKKLYYKTTLSYVGDNFYGFQIQPDKPTVQGELESALSKLYGEKIVITPSGRTDVGVHALSQTVSFCAPDKLTAHKLKIALNHFMPDGIRIQSVAVAEDNFNARIYAHSKTYEYLFYIAEEDNPFYNNRAYRINNVDVEIMKNAAKLFEGEHDFKNFYCIGSSAKTTIRNITSCQINCIKADAALFNQPLYCVRVTAKGFLYKMVRLIVGCLIRAGEGKLSLAEVKQMIDCKITAKKIPAPAYGLYLKEVIYK